MSDNEELEHISELLQINIQVNRELEKKMAMQQTNTPADIVLQKKRVEKEIRRLQKIKQDIEAANRSVQSEDGISDREFGLITSLNMANVAQILQDNLTTIVQLKAQVDEQVEYIDTMQNTQDQLLILMSRILGIVEKHDAILYPDKYE
jgi:hypothetical protein